MTPEETIAAATLMIDYATAQQAGKPFEIQVAEFGRRNYITADPVWNWHECTYRRKPETVTVYVWRDQHGGMRISSAPGYNGVVLGSATIELKEPKP